MVRFPLHLAVELTREAAAAGVFSSDGSSWLYSCVSVILLFVPVFDHQCWRVTDTCRGWQVDWDVDSSPDEPFSSALATLMAFCPSALFLFAKDSPGLTVSMRNKAVLWEGDSAARK